MDTKDDFLLSQKHISQKYNLLQEGEYIVIQTRSGSWRLYPLHRGFSYRQAESFCSTENLGSDYCHYSVRIMHNRRLHRVDTSGRPTKLSKEQDWQIQQEYYNARFVEDEDCEIETCPCSYPVFWSWQVPGASGQTVRDWRPVTCLVEDHGREINHCPNCNQSLLSLPEEEVDSQGEGDGWWNWEQIPDTCQGCQYYNPNKYISCAVHPFGAEADFCPDYCL